MRFEVILGEKTPRGRHGNQDRWDFDAPSFEDAIATAKENGAASPKRTPGSHLFVYGDGRLMSELGPNEF